MRPCLAWLQSKQNWPFLRLYLSLSLSFSYISFFLSGYPPRVPKQREEVPRFPSEKGEGRGLRQPTNPPCFPAHGRARERGRCITYQSSCRGRLTQREGENITRNDQNMQMITSSRTTLISFFPSQSLADQPDRPANRSQEKTFLQGNVTGLCTIFEKKCKLIYHHSKNGCHCILLGWINRMLS